MLGCLWEMRVAPVPVCCRSDAGSDSDDGSDEGSGRGVKVPLSLSPVFMTYPKVRQGLLVFEWVVM